MNILALGAHPDDIEIGCGGLLIKSIRDGHNVFTYTLTRGSASGNPVVRTREIIQSANFLRVKTSWIDNFEDTKLSLSDDLINHIEYFINKSKADIIYTHSVADNHHDHIAVALSTIEAGRHVPSIFSYENPVTKNFRPQAYYDISDVIDDKIELMNIFLSQKNKMFIQSNAIKGLAQYRALQSRLNGSITSVEAFEVMKLSFDGFKLTENKGSFNQNKLNITKLKEIVEYSPIAHL